MTTTTRAEADLVADIERAHKSGDQARLRRLQEEYRHGGYAVVRLSPEPPQLISGPSRSRATPARSTASSPLDDVLRAPALGVVPGSRLQVVVTARAVDSLRSSAYDTGLETGGFLYGRRDGDEIVVENLTEVRDTHRTSTNVVLTRSHLRDWANHFEAARWQPIGDWHCHPNIAGTIYTSPSEPDRTGWRLMAEESRGIWIGLLLTPWRTSEQNGDEWGVSLPKITAWATPPDATVCSPARLIIEEEAT